MRIAGLYDIHANLPALEAVLRDVRDARVDQIVVGGDAIIGPMPRETLQLLLDLDLPVHFIHGNCELAVLAQMAAPNPDLVTYWGTTSGKPLPPELVPGYRWTAEQLEPDYEPLLAAWPKTLRLDISGLGQVLFCHATPRSETEIFTRLTPADKLMPLFAGLDASVVVCGHTHMQFDRMVGNTRVVNAGSVGEPFGQSKAFWVLLGPDVELRQTTYDIMQAIKRIRATAYPQAEEVANGLVNPPMEEEILQAFGQAEIN